MTISLPEQVVEATATSPKVLIIFSLYKVGKTSLVAQLKNNLIIDLEDGSDHVSGLKIKANSYQEINAICEEVEKKGRPYRYGTVDTTTMLEDLCIPLAAKLYANTPMGTGFKGDILSLPNGLGYYYLRQAFEMVVDRIKKAFDRVILLGHSKDKLINKNGKELSAKELSLTGKLAALTCAKADAIGYMYRDGNKCMITFDSGPGDIICGARPKHLRNSKFIISEEVNGELKTYWDKIYLD